MESFGPLKAYIIKNLCASPCSAPEAGSYDILGRA